MNYKRDTNPAAGDNCVSLANQVAQCYYAEYLLFKQKSVKLQQGQNKFFKKIQYKNSKKSLTIKIIFDLILTSF